jgi:hypothetical protein
MAAMMMTRTTPERGSWTLSILTALAVALLGAELFAAAGGNRVLGLAAGALCIATACVATVLSRRQARQRGE